MSTDTIPLKRELRPEARGPIVGVVRETFPSENRVALVPSSLMRLKKLRVPVIVEQGAGLAAGIRDDDYAAQGATVVPSRADVFKQASVIVQVRAAGANPGSVAADCALLHDGQVVIASCNPLAQPQPFAEYATRKVNLFALELLPRIARAQTMDVLSSMSTIAGYKAVILAADHLPRMFPLMMTAAGTVAPARVFIIGTGVSGLSAVAAAKRLGAVVTAHDIRTGVKEQVESLGGRFVGIDVAGQADAAGGYARQMSEEFYRKQRELIRGIVAASDVVITTASVPGKKAPLIITREMLPGMPPGAVIVDLAAEQGGNCEATRAGETLVEQSVTVIGPMNIASSVPYHSSQMYSNNVTAFLQHLITDERVKFDLNDEITRETLVIRSGEIVQPAIRELLGLPNAAPGAPVSPFSTEI